MPNKVERFLNLNPSPIEILGILFLLCFLLVWIVYLIHVGSAWVLILFAPAVLYPIYRVLRLFWYA